MSEIKRNEIIYDEGWRESSPAPEEKIPVDEQPAPQAAQERGSFPLLISIQLCLCILAGALVFVLRAMDSDIYHELMTAYRVEMNKPLISRELFGAPYLTRSEQAENTAVKASADEPSPR